MEWQFQCKRQSRLLQGMFEDSNGVISSFKSKDIQCKWLQKKTSNDRQNTTQRKLKMEQNEFSG
jgi:protoheme ferro-lyase